MKRATVLKKVENVEHWSSALPSLQARRRLMSVKGEPFLFADWDSASFFHFVISPELLRPHIPRFLELDLYQGKACLSLVAVSMRKLRTRSPISLGSLFRLIDCQTFLNLRTYVHFHDEPGALFLWGWLSNPFPIPVPFRGIKLPCSFADLRYDHEFESGNLRGIVTSKDKSGLFQYHASLERQMEFTPSPRGSLAEFAMERYTGFFSRGSSCYLFRTWHPTWQQQQINAVVDHHSLITNHFPWFEEARFDSANFALGFDDVYLGHARSLNKMATAHNHHAILSGFYEMP
jgi:uncharacterized protein YqjF (DUF2071 family)